MPAPFSTCHNCQIGEPDISFGHPRATPCAPAHTHAKVTAHQEWVSHMSIVVFTLKCMCVTMIADGSQPQTCAGAWSVMRWRMQCGRGVTCHWLSE